MNVLYHTGHPNANIIAKFHEEETCGFNYPTARQLARSADAFIAQRDSTGGKTILAGYPLFSDWGRDTMIALPGCTLAAGQFSDAQSILRIFLAYEKDGLVPNLFPEGGNAVSLKDSTLNLPAYGVAVLLPNP